MVVALAPPGISAADITITASTGGGFLYGVVTELVYGTYNNQPYTESELDWDLKALAVTTVSLDLRTSAGLTASLGVQLGVPWKTGSVSDSDWLNASVNDITTRTNYSQQDCFTERAILLDFKAGWEIPLAAGVAFEPFLAFGFMDFKWTARDGYLQYPPGWFGHSATKPYPDSSTDTVIPVSGTSIIYEQTYFIPAAGLEGKVTSGNFSGSVSFAFSPFVFCNDVDNHEFALYDYYDTMSNGLLLEPKISLAWRMGGGRLSLDVSYRHIAGLIGNTRQVTTGPGTSTTTNYSNGAGASYDALSVSLGFCWEP